jgi:hypothetical protein
MFTLLTRLSRSELMFRQAPIVVAALVIAEIFYKFHSFLLETGAFLLTWFVLDAIVSAIARIFPRSQKAGTSHN